MSSAGGRSQVWRVHTLRSWVTIRPHAVWSNHLLCVHDGAHVKERRENSEQGSVLGRSRGLDPEITHFSL